MMTIREREEQLFVRWAERARKLRDADAINKDGLLYRGELHWNGLYQAHRPGNEEQLWNDAGMRLMVLTKELDEEDMWDIRAETGRVPSPRLTNRTAMRFFPNLELWVYGLMTIPERKVLSFSRADNATRLQGFYENAPIARVVCKKQPDGKAASNAVLQRYMKEYADLLAEQIVMYKADIILCTGGQGIMVNYLREHVYRDLEDVNAHCFYSPSANVLVVKQFHPCYTVYSRKDMYTSMVRDYQEFLKATPQFPAVR
jgi:hypothetical protein